MGPISVSQHTSTIYGFAVQLPGGGKRGGVRIIYYLRTAQGQIWMLTIYGKSQETVIPAHVLRQIKEEIDDP